MGPGVVDVGDLGCDASVASDASDGGVAAWRRGGVAAMVTLAARQ
jgi:hypothetical protein